MSMEALRQKWPVQESRKVRDVVDGGERPACCTPATPIAGAAALFSPEVELVLVNAADGRLAGVVSKYDLVCHLANQGGPDASTEAVMSKDVVTGVLDDPLHELWGRMVERNIRSVPIVADTGAPVAVLSRRQVTDLLLESLETEDTMLRDYVMGVGYR